ncbi:3-hydroxylacyl-ACP dehydratase [Protofrankia sp. BMG5.30]|uniref:3-hydroxylacyl-ACP dehydratase n=2 Tax=Frankiaceae TaxID=74712 RepID=A0ABR5F6N7_9ACTN|nr:3-hydroxylacyl-ACP dehydratase [Protofrankia coriariae]ONH37292.1 3-hydroxylacyl-ACP dehydratase [Protofrankia sp. BMG5.30]
MRFHLVDRIDSWESNRRIVGRKVTSGTEQFWRAGLTGPVMPPPLVLEALCQAGTWLVMMSSGHRKRAALLSVGEVSFLGDVTPGDVLLLDGTVVSISDEVAVLDGTVSVGERTVLTATSIMCALIDAERLDDPVATARMADQLTGAVSAP